MHFTLVKPFDAYHIHSINETFDPTAQRKFLKRVKEQHGGIFVKEITWWGSVYEDMLYNLGDTCRSAFFHEAIKKDSFYSTRI